MLLKVREYDFITTGDEIATNGRVLYLPAQLYKQLEEQAIIYQQQDIQAILPTYKNGIGLGLQIQNYVGTIELNETTQLEIMPKIKLANDEREERKILTTMIQVYLGNAKEIDDINLTVAKLPLHEQFIRLFVTTVQQVIKKGLKSNYIAYEDNLNVLKGKLLLNKHLVKNSITKEKSYVTYDEYSQDTSENQTLKSALLLVERKTKQLKLKMTIRKLLTHFEGVTTTHNNTNQNKIKITRLNQHYETALTQANIILSNQTMTTYTGQIPLISLLFPMERIFETYVANQIQQSEYGRKYEVILQNTDRYLFEEQRDFQLKPDIMLQNKEETIILDTKWKDIQDIKKDISQADIYQMYVYAKKYEARKVVLLYPKNDVYGAGVGYRYEDYDEVVIEVVFVDTSKHQSNIQSYVK